MRTTRRGWTGTILAGAAVLGAETAKAAVLTDGAGHVMELRITAGGGSAVSGGFDLVTVTSGPVAPAGTSGTGFEAFPLSPETFAVPVALSRFSLE